MLIETWAKSLPLNNLIVSMVDKQALTTSEKLCDPCQFNTESVKAVSWCSTCEEALCKSCDKCHRSFKMTSNRYAYFFAAIHLTGPRLSLIALSPQPQYRWILHFHTSGVKVLRLEYNRVSNDPRSTLRLFYRYVRYNNLSHVYVGTFYPQQKSKHIDEMIENRKENIGVIDKKTADILANIHLILDNSVTSSDKVMTVFLFKEVTFSFILSNELQQKNKHIDEMIENRKENIGVIDNKTGDILANISVQNNLPVVNGTFNTG
jgi:hypothetical protein